MNKKEVNRKKRHCRIRKKIIGTPEAPRLSVRRSLANFHAQLIDDHTETTIVGFSTAMKEIRTQCPYGGNVKAAEALGVLAAAAMKEKGINKIRFDRSGYLYHGRVKAFADSLRKNGIQF